MQEGVQEYIRVNDQEIPYSVRISDRARNISIKITAKKGIELVMPRRASMQRAQYFMNERAQWIAQHYEVYTANKGEAKERSRVKPGQMWMIAGDEYRIEHVSRACKKIRIRFSSTDPEVVEVHGREYDAEEWEQAFAQFCKKLAKIVLKERLHECAYEIGEKVNSVSIRNQASRWGSCSNRRNINLNWRLILAPRQIMDAVIYHELAHLTEMNHSRNFWELLEKYDSQAKKHDKWLKKEGNKILHIFEGM